MTKCCSKCAISKPLTSFRRHSARPGQYQSWCRDCMRERMRAIDYPRRKKRRKELKAWRRTYLLSHPCVDCGQSNPSLLVFDHITERRKLLHRMICHMINLARPIFIIYEEVAKCEVRCQPCHMRRHYVAGETLPRSRNPVSCI